MEKKREMYRGMEKIPRFKLFLIMKLTFFFLVLGLLEVHASTYAQVKMVDLDVKEMALRDVFEELKRQTELEFFFSNRELDMNSRVTICVEKADLMDVLGRILGQRYHFEIMEGMVIIKPVAAVDSVRVKSTRVKGFVYDTKKQPLPGVTVKVVGVAVGTATNAKGWFAIDLPMQKGALEFSFVGFKKQQVAFSKMTDTLRIVLEEDVSDLDEVVVRAYGSQKKREMISAISTVTAEEMKELPVANLATLLQGRLAGVNIIQQSGAPGSGSVVAVRGFNSLLVNGASDGQPLWVIDGVPMLSFEAPATGTNTLADLDPSMIESVQVLKDAAAASIYGSRAGNGVILVTTKKGKEGQAKFSANVSYSVSQLIEYPTQVGGRMERWLDIMYRRNMKGVYTTRDERNNRVTYYPTSYDEVYGTNGSYDQFWGNGANKSGISMPMLQDSLDNYYNNSENWWKYVFRTGKVLSANLQASGGTAHFRYMVGAGVYDEKGISINSGYSRANLLTNLTMQFTPRLRMDTRIYLAYMDKSKNKSGISSRYEGIGVDPTSQLTTVAASDELKKEWLARIEGKIDRTDNYRAMSSVFLEYKLPLGLSASLSGNVDFAQSNLNMFTESSLDANYHENRSAGSIGRTIMLSAEGLLGYKKSVKEKHNIDLLFGINANKEQNFMIEGEGIAGPSDDIYYYTPIQSIVWRGEGDNAYPASTMTYKSDFTEKRMLSFFGRVGYNYKQRYLFEFTFRRDGSSTFGEGNRWANFPSFALGWAFSEESFFKKWCGSWLNWGKVRGSYGTSGQIFTSPYLAHGLMDSYGSAFVNNVGMSASKPLSPDLTWEKTEQYNIGLDMDMFDYRLNVKLDYYYKYTSSLIYEVPLPRLYPFSKRTENAMAVSNEGLELELQADIVRKDNLSWRMKFNIARNWNRFEKSYSGKDIDGLVIGRPLSGLYVYKHEGYYESDAEVPRYYTVNGMSTYISGVSEKSATSGKIGDYKLKDFNGDSSPDTYYAGSTLPVAHGGWVNELIWKGFDLNVLFNYSLGRKMINARMASAYSLMKTVPKLYDYRDVTVWSKPGDDADAPAWGYSINYLLDSSIETVHYLMLKQLTVGYNVPALCARKIGFSGIRCFFTVENLFYLSNYSGENPEVIDVYGGIDNGLQYPLPRKWTLGLTLNF